MEKQVHKMTQSMGIGAQFGGKYFCHDVRVVRLPRHGASCPVGIGVSCSADRQVGIFIVVYMDVCVIIRIDVCLFKCKCVGECLPVCLPVTP